MEPAEEAPQDEEKRKRRPPLLAITLVRKVMDVSSISVEELSRRIHAGVLMNDNKLKFCVDPDCGKNCFLLLAKSIHGINENGGNWTWIDEKEKCYEGEVSVQVAEMASVDSAELSATFKTIMLSPKTTYYVEFVVKLKDGWQSHGRLDLSLTLPDGTRRERTDGLPRTPAGIWKHVPVGTFVTTPKNVGEITTNCTFSNGWTNELIVKGIVLRPQSFLDRLYDEYPDVSCLEWFGNHDF
ncbi:uncharacterized protein PHLOEM PROTEIN 2-LIKE A4-like [Eucalyptus grandis]|uniref:uncharacterized protein PHLOEM PROTEIN 2-LIKE A4-like n=1 Tax=Eucalyptus grandis TaxID=71139 RepID=UPI00192ED70D|nr:uncharacterized protein PHLOEM PROTEIN 2-LIKE A4-like [Eucalyptus grandis]